MKINLLALEILFDTDTCESVYEIDLSKEIQELGATEQNISGIKFECNNLFDIVYSSLEENISNKKTCGILEKAIIEKFNSKTKGVNKDEDNKNFN
ncbi:MAG: hypothetical protein RR766_09550 [Longicatena sp.]